MIKNFTLIIFCIGIINTVSAQNYAVGERTITFIDEARSGRQIPTEVYYPADNGGSNVPPASGIGKFPVVVFGHGFVIPPSAYEWLADSLVKRGYILAFPSTESDLSPSHSAFGDDLLFLCNRITSLNDSSGSFLYQRVIKKAAVAGHSMGGGSSFLAAAGNPTAINAIFNFSAAETNPSAIAAATLVNKPALIFSGSGDCIVPAATQLQMFTNIIASCKTYINITGALHCQFANNNGTCALGQLLSGCNSSAISPAVVFNKSVALIGPFLDFYLKDNCTRGDDYLNAYDALTGAEKMRTCNSFPACGVLPVNLENFNGRLADSVVILKWKTAVEDDIEYFLPEKSANGIAFQPLQPVNAIGASGGYLAVDHYPYAGYSYYRLKMVTHDGQTSTSAIIKVITARKSRELLSLFPNPVKRNLQVEIFSEKIQKASIVISGPTGQMLMNIPVSLDAGTNKKDISLSKLLAGVYILAVKNNEGIVIGSLKVIKE